MLGRTHILVLVLAISSSQVSAQANGDEAPFFDCPETNGKFRDLEQCDLFYICRKGVATIEYCPEGLLFDDSIPNHEKCVLPHNVDCGTREFVQEPSPDRDEKCEKANGVFDFPDEGVCDKYIQCDNGRAFEFPCPNHSFSMSRLEVVSGRSKLVTKLAFVKGQFSMRLMDSAVPEEMS
eukprot:TRINITY_DN410_c0_g1_i16.p1 TRINITY_DN410_c0_g1~~TRINITY_DN410_c0_g1_i16.p1  ORF type:complete len:203 (-),score=60.92 TRINITY_DN410_c0_g1_i16:41-577(-)